MPLHKLQPSASFNLFCHMERMLHTLQDERRPLVQENTQPPHIKPALDAVRLDGDLPDTAQLNAGPSGVAKAKLVEQPLRGQSIVKSEKASYPHESQGEPERDNDRQGRVAHRIGTPPGAERPGHG